MVDDFKLKKLDAMKNVGINPYPYSFERTHTASQVHAGFEKLEGKAVVVAGRIIGMRKMGSLNFLDLLDWSGKIQVILKKNANGGALQPEMLDSGDIIGVMGKTAVTKSGEKSIDAETVTVLAKSLRTLPEKFHGLTDTEMRYRKRYLDLIMNQQTRKIFAIRTALTNFIRNYLNANAYLEVETPVLQHTYGGANAKPFITHHNALDADLYLRVANELYLKRMIIGGAERVYEFSKDFRNEDIDSTHNPEFTQIEIYEAYSDYNAFMDLAEEILSGFAKEVSGGSRIEYKGKEIVMSQKFNRIYLVEEIRKRAGIDVLNMSEESAKDLAEAEKLDIKTKNRYHVVDALFDKYIKPHLWNPTIVMDFPAFMCPLAKDKRGDPKLSERFELFIAGIEVANCYSELTDPIEQRKKFEEQALERSRGDDEQPPIDEDFIEAIEYGMPPTAGIGISIDRLAMIFTGCTSIKEVILFPEVRNMPKFGE